MVLNRRNSTSGSIAGNCSNKQSKSASNQTSKENFNKTLNMHRLSLYNAMSPIDILAFSDNIKAKHYGI
jgi:activator of HSP90 ATPase